jgi:cobalt-zinc-cadmium efflux system protein
VTPGGHPGDAFLQKVAGDLRSRFEIGHATVQIELNDAGQCDLQPDSVL